MHVEANTSTLKVNGVVTLTALRERVPGPARAAAEHTAAWARQEVAMRVTTRARMALAMASATVQEMFRVKASLSEVRATAHRVRVSDRAAGKDDVSTSTSSGVGSGEIHQTPNA